MQEILKEESDAEDDEENEAENAYNFQSGAQRAPRRPPQSDVEPCSEWRVFNIAPKGTAEIHPEAPINCEIIPG
ncbi:unnamed protein product [Heligmosomoides polygyrus]|uniref:Uncharacterized protein n=1 Tax=Heligmosomoides polygyrus TaxID=6339 RepID=A0A183FK44_HELPZ|nr:unnamed protein product [Heligmosomoides polygyrus]